MDMANFFEGYRVETVEVYALPDLVNLANTDWIVCTSRGAKLTSTIAESMPANVEDGGHTRWNPKRVYFSRGIVRMMGTIDLTRLVRSVPLHSVALPTAMLKRIETMKISARFHPTGSYIDGRLTDDPAAAFPSGEREKVRTACDQIMRLAMDQLPTASFAAWFRVQAGFYETEARHLISVGSLDDEWSREQVAKAAQEAELCTYPVDARTLSAPEKRAGICFDRPVYVPWD